LGSNYNPLNVLFIIKFTSDGDFFVCILSTKIIQNYYRNEMKLS
jgi:hypothetical protein